MAWSPARLSISPPPGAPTLLEWRKIRSRELQNYRDLLIALPPSWSQGRSYPVVVMHDGQNLFDPETSHAGDWNLLEVMRDLAAEGIEAIIVGIANTGPFRRYEYSPFRDPVHGGGDGDRYLDFIIGTVLPLIAKDFSLSLTPETTSIAGSSMGGLLSLYGLWKHPDCFGAAAALSPSVWFADEAIIRMVETHRLPPGRLWLDIGIGEGEQMVAAVRQLRDAIEARGLPQGKRFRYLEDPAGLHNEKHWGGRFRAALPFILGAVRAEQPDTG